MSRPCHARPLARCLVLAAALLPGPGFAQSPEGGVRLAFGLSQRVEASDNLSFVPEGKAGSRADSALSFALSSETRRQRLAREGGITLRAVTGGVPGLGSGLTEPRVALSYDHLWPSAAFSARARVSAADIAFFRPLSDAEPGAGPIELPEDFDALRGTGTRIDRGLDLGLKLGRDGPAGLDLGLGVGDLRYLDTPGTGLPDSRHLRLAADLRLGLSPVTEARIGLGYLGLDRQGAAAREEAGLDFGLSRAHPLGETGVAFAWDRVDAGDRFGLAARRSQELARGGIEAELGVTRGAEGGVHLTGALLLRRELANGGFGVSGARSLRSTQAGEARVTTFALDRGWALRDDLDLGFDLRAARRMDADSGDATHDLEAGATLGYALSRRWSLDLGYRHRQRLGADDDRITANGLSLNLRRDIIYRR
ncbi:hypothetical protein [Limimaricola sp.]|uniref:hypothetical protein n=1 Tax=Limimaricola sp. TaxID=2211665 RepID=UPI0040591301